MGTAPDKAAPFCCVTVAKCTVLHFTMYSHEFLGSTATIGTAHSNSVKRKSELKKFDWVYAGHFLFQIKGSLVSHTWSSHILGFGLALFSETSGAL